MITIRNVLKQYDFPERKRESIRKRLGEEFYADKVLRVKDANGNMLLCIEEKDLDWLTFLLDNSDLSISDANSIYMVKECRNYINRIKELAPNSFTPEKQSFDAQELSIVLEKGEKTCKKYLNELYRLFPEMITSTDPLSCNLEGIEWILFTIKGMGNRELIKKWNLFYRFLYEQLENGQSSDIQG